MNNGKKKVFTIFGGTGDLTYRKLIPAFYNLRALDKLSEDFELVIIGRREYTKDAYMELVRPWVTQFSRLPFKEETFNELTSHITYLQMDFMKLDQYEILNKFYNKFPSNQQRLYYLAVAPEFFSVISNHLKEAKMVENDHIHQVMIEKPFGHNIESAMALHEDLAKAFGSDDIYRIDHYLGKEMIQNILSIRFNNALFEGIWNYEQIDNIQISALETVGVENRGNYYDHTGALKDMVQNHLFQVLSIVAMDKPTSFSAEDIQSEQVKVLDSLRFLSEDEVSSHMVLGQYGGGYLSDHCVRAYREEDNVDPNSTTETYVSLKLQLNHPRWTGVPMYLRTGKRCAKRSTEVVIQFKSALGQKPNLLIIRIYPDEGVYLRFNAKKAGSTQEVVPVFMDFCQSCVYENRINTPEAYERLIEAALNEDRSLFTSWDQVLSSWRYIDHLEALREKVNLPVYPYVAGKNGPVASDYLLEASGHYWIEEESESV